MKLFIYSINYSPELTGIGKYNGEMISWLSKTERQTTLQVLSAKPYYPEWEIRPEYKGGLSHTSVENGVPIERCSLYVPNNPTSIKRILHLSSFAATSGLSLLKRLFKKSSHPDVLFVVEPTLFITPLALLFAKLTGAKTVLHIQDYEVDAMIGLGLAGGNTSTISRIAFGIESWLMKRFDKISTISYSMMNKAEAKGVKKEDIIFFPNWADTNLVTPNASGTKIRQQWDLDPSDKVVLYAGNMGAKQGLEMVLEAAVQYQRLAKFDNKVKFVFVGAGAHVDFLKEMSAGLHLTNIIFKPLQEWEDVPAMLAMADIHLVVQKKGAADSVLPSKLTNILSVGGNAVVTAEKDTELGQLPEKYPGIYTLAEPENLNAFVTALDTELANLESNESGDDYNKVARQYAEQHLNKDAILSKFLDNMRQLTNQ